MDDCIFCKLVAGQIPSAKIYEDDRILAFLDIQPFNKGHVLVIPKSHFPKMVDTPDDLVKDIFVVAKKIAQAQLVALEARSFNLLVYGDDVPHFHVHVYPRFEGDGIHAWPHKKYDDGEMDDIAKKIIASM